MPLDELLLESARSAGTRLTDAERQAFLARADYHTAIRRLHLGGGSLREIAEALSLSHQRVQQIVSAAGGSWWTSWRTRNRSRDAVCSWCGRPPSEVSKLIAGPRVYICDDCVAAAEAAIAGRRQVGAGDWQVVTNSSVTTRCDFCRKRPADNRPVVVGAARVCAECLRACREILDGRV